MVAQTSAPRDSNLDLDAPARKNRMAEAAARWLNGGSLQRAIAVHFRVSGLSAEPFRRFYGLSDAALAEFGIKRYVADRKPAFPDRIEMRDAEPGETLLLLNHVCQPADTPYRASHAIFVREGAEQTYDRVDEIPNVMRLRLQSLRAYDTAGMMLDADVGSGDAIEPLIERLFANPAVAYIHAHNAKRGCYAGRIERA
jgi:hypothetical protein